MTRKRKTKDVEFTILTCLSHPVKTVTLRIPVNADPSRYEGKAMAKAGITNYICGSCYDNAYYVRYRTL